MRSQALDTARAVHDQLLDLVCKQRPCVEDRGSFFFEQCLCI